MILSVGSIIIHQHAAARPKFADSSGDHIQDNRIGIIGEEDSVCVLRQTQEVSGRHKKPWASQLNHPVKYLGRMTNRRWFFWWHGHQTQQNRAISGRRPLHSTNALVQLLRGNHLNSHLVMITPFHYSLAIALLIKKSIAWNTVWTALKDQYI